MQNDKGNKGNIVFMMGLPAAGKSRTGSKLFGDTHIILDCDKIKASHPSYDPKQPQTLHAWSAGELERLFEAAIFVGAGNWVIDGTGANAEKLVYRMSRARAAGFTITLVFVVCDLETSLRRNARRTRTVPENIVREKAQTISTSFQLVAPYADQVQVIDNSTDS